MNKCLFTFILFFAKTAFSQTVSTNYYPKPHLLWDSVCLFKIEVQSGIGMFGTKNDDIIISTGAYGYSWSGLNEKAEPSFKNTNSIFLGVGFKLDLPNNPVSPFIDANIQNGYMTMHFFDNNDNETQKNIFRNILMIKIAPGISLDWKYFSFGGDLGLGYIGGGKFTGKPLPKIPAAIQDNHIYWNKHVLIGPEVFIALHYKKWSAQAAIFYGYTKNINFDQMNAVKFTLGFNFFSRK